MTLTHVGAREAAYTILELDRGQQDENWLKTHYNRNQRERIQQHIRFADYWYAANGQFTDLKKHCRDIARDAGLKLSPEEAFRWLSQGGFTNDILGQAAIGGFDPTSIKQVIQRFSDKDTPWQISGFNIFKLNLQNTKKELVPVYTEGHITQVNCYIKDGKRLPITGIYELLLQVLERTSDIQQINQGIQKIIRSRFSPHHAQVFFNHALQALEVMVNEGWVRAKLDKKKPKLQLSTPNEGEFIHSHRN